MFRRRSPTIAPTLVRPAYSLAILLSLSFGVGFGFAATQWLLGAPPGQGLATHSPIYVQSWIHWVMSCALASCLLSFPLVCRQHGPGQYGRAHTLLRALATSPKATIR